MNGVAVKEGSHREKLLDGALRCLREKGYARTTARDLVAASGTNLSSIGYHFGSKDALLNEAIAAGFREWTAEVERAMFTQESASAAERLALSLEAMIDRFEELRPFLVSFVEALPQAMRSPELRDQLADAYRECREAGARMVSRALTEQGTAVSREQSETLASVGMAISDGLMLQWLVDPDAAPTAERVMEALVAALPVLPRA
jgi:AcrR family transcriptional regulator